MTCKEHKIFLFKKSNS